MVGEERRGNIPGEIHFQVYWFINVYAFKALK